MASGSLRQLHEEYQFAAGDRSALSPPSDRFAATIMAVTVAMQKLSFLSQFCTASQLAGIYGAGSWSPFPRFCINQHAKLRVIDDGSRSSHNATYASAETTHTTSVTVFARLGTLSAVPMIVLCNIASFYMRRRAICGRPTVKTRPKFS